MSDDNRVNPLIEENARLRAELDKATNAQLSRDDLKSMSPADIVTAQKAGRLRDIMGGK